MLSRALSYSDGDAPDRLPHGSGRAGAGKSRSWQEPFPDILGHLQRLPQKPAGLVEERPGFVAPGLSAPALYDGQRNGLAACLVPYLQRRRRPALPGEGSAEAEGRQAGRRGRINPTASAAGNSRPHLQRRPHGPNPRGRSRKAKARAGAPAAMASGWQGRLQRPTPIEPADGQAPVQAATDSKQGTKQKLGKRAKPAAEEPPKTEETARGEAAKDGPSGDAARTDAAKTEAAKTECCQD